MMSGWEYAELIEERAASSAPSEAEVAALGRRVRESASAGARASRRGAFVALGGLVALAAAAVVTWAAIDVAPEVAEPAPLAAVDWAEAAPRDGVALRYQGDGEVVSAEQIAWEEGVLEVEVEPNQGIQLAVVTDEAEVRVVGTKFAVERDTFGTRVTVDHGKVAVSCVDGTDTAITAGQEARCLRSAAAGLGWALSLQKAGATPEVRLAAVDRALSQPDPTPAVRDELSALRAPLLAELGRADEALATAESVLEHGERPDLRQLAAQTALEVGGCDAAVPHLEALVASDPVGARLHLARCVAEADPTRAVALVDEALTAATAAGATEQQLDAIRATLRR